MAYSESLRFGRSNWSLLYEGDEFLVRHSETVSDAVARALCSEFPDCAAMAETHEWRMVHLKSMQTYTMDTFLYVFARGGAADAGATTVADVRLSRVQAGKLTFVHTS